MKTFPMRKKPQRHLPRRNYRRRKDLRRSWMAAAAGHAAAAADGGTKVGRLTAKRPADLPSPHWMTRASRRPTRAKMNAKRMLALHQRAKQGTRRGRAATSASRMPRCSAGAGDAAAAAGGGGGAATIGRREPSPAKRLNADMSRLDQPETSDRPIGNWSDDESEQPPYRHDAGRPSEPAIEATTRDDASFSIRSDDSSRQPARPRHRPRARGTAAPQRTGQGGG